MDGMEAPTIIWNAPMAAAAAVLRGGQQQSPRGAIHIGREDAQQSRHKYILVRIARTISKCMMLNRESRAQTRLLLTMKRNTRL